MRENTYRVIIEMNDVRRTENMRRGYSFSRDFSLKSSL